ncbi:MAG: hypothetical protein RIF41_01805 [Polyangiaceae bacterium]
MKNHKRLTIIAAFGAGAVTFSLASPSWALKGNIGSPCSCSYSVPNLDASGHDFYSKLKFWGGGSGSPWCGVAMAQLADAYGFEENFSWGPGYGYLQCDITKPFGRTMNAITALRSASANTITGTLFQFQTAAFPLLDWAFLWTANKMDATLSFCEHGSKPRSASQVGPKKVELYVRRSESCGQGFFHGLDAAERAGLMVHETRHIGGPGHYTATKDFSFGGGGAYEFEATWLRQFAEDGSVFTTLLRCSAADRAQSILNNNFVIPAPVFDEPADC